MHLFVSKPVETEITRLSLKGTRGSFERKFFNSFQGRLPEEKMLNQGAVMIFTGLCGALVVMAVAYCAYW